MTHASNRKEKMVSTSPQVQRCRQGDLDDYYDPCYYMLDTGSPRGPGSSSDEFEIRQPGKSARKLPTPPRSSPCMDVVVRRRAPAWISRLLKTNLPEGAELEDLFVNMLLLGRIADVIHGVLDSCAESTGQEDQEDQEDREDQNGGVQGTRAGASPGVPRRGSRASPYSPYSPWSHSLYSPWSSRPQHISLGERPYRVMAQDYDRFCALCARLEIREDSRFSFNDVEQKAAGERIGMCIWDISNALHDKSVTGELPEYVGKVIPKFTEPNVPSPSPLKKRGPVARGVRHSGRDGMLASNTPHDDLCDGPTQWGDGSAHERDPHGAKGKDRGAGAYELDASTRVLTSILTPGRGKPKHSKILNAVMMSDFCDEGKMGGEQTSPLPKIVDRHDRGPSPDTGGAAKTPEAGKKVNSKAKKNEHERKQDSARRQKADKGKAGANDMMVHVAKFTQDEGAVREGGHPLGALISLLKPLALAAVGAISVVVVQGGVAERKERQWRRGMAGRW